MRNSFDFKALFRKVRKSDSSKRKKVILVLGNESADLDSIVASTSYAALANYLHKDAIHLPVIQIQRADLQLRTECSFVLQNAEIDSSNLLFLNEIQKIKDHLLKRKDTGIVLVDHNKLLPHWTEYADRVEAVFDHRDDEGLYQSAKPRIIEVVGSATSLVVKHFKGGWAQAYEKEKVVNSSWHNPLARYLISAILVDTVNLDVTKGRAKPQDKEAAEFLLSIIQPTDEATYRDTYFRDLLDAKANVTHLPSHDLLRKDFKQWTMNGYRVGIASVTWHFQGWASREGHISLFQAFRSFAQERRIDLLVVMTSHHDSESGFQREILICPLNENLKKSEDFIRKYEMSDLNLVRKHSNWAGKNLSGTDRDVYIYQQNNTISSRKQVYPLTRRILESIVAKK